MGRTDTIYDPLENFTTQLCNFCFLPDETGVRLLKTAECHGFSDDYHEVEDVAHRPARPSYLMISGFHRVSMKKLKRRLRRCELSRSLQDSVFTMGSLPCLIHLQNTSFMFALHRFGLWGGGLARSLLHWSSRMPDSESEKRVRHEEKQRCLSD